MFPNTAGPDSSQWACETHSEQQGRDGSAASDVNHGQQAGEVSFPRSSQEQPERRGAMTVRVLREEPAGVQLENSSRDNGSAIAAAGCRGGGQRKTSRNARNAQREWCWTGNSRGSSRARTTVLNLDLKLSHVHFQSVLEFQ